MADRDGSTSRLDEKDALPRDAGQTDDQHQHLDSLTSANIDNLRNRAGQLLKKERRSHTLSPTALVSEVFIRFAGQRKRTWDDQQGFLAAAGVMMRRILSNHGRDRKALKRGSGRPRVSLGDESIEQISGGGAPDMVRLALDKLQERDPRLAEIVELRLYRGLSCKIIAELLNSSQRTIEREWTAGRSWLRAELVEESDE